MTLMLLVSTLQAFIEGSSLGEFRTRLQMLLVFHCHVLLMPQVEGKGEDIRMCVSDFFPLILPYAVKMIRLWIRETGVWMHARF